MSDLAILRPPPSMRSGDDVLGPETIAGLCSSGIATELYELWPEWWAKYLWHSSLPGRRRLFEKLPARVNLKALYQTIANSKVVWINGSSLPNNPNCSFEIKCNARDQKTIFHLQDDWFSIPSARMRTENCARLARLVIVPTDNLKYRVESALPETCVVKLEEPINIERFKGVTEVRSESPFLAWTGNPNNLKEIPYLVELLGKLHRSYPFTLRIISGHKRPNLNLSVPWEWHAYDQANEANLLAGATAGLAPLSDTPYTQCKGAYKVKTYLAAGIPVIASPVGHQKELVTPSQNGFLPKNKTEWLDSISILLENSDQAGAMGNNGREYAIKHLSHKTLMPQWASKLKKYFNNI